MFCLVFVPVILCNLLVFACEPVMIKTGILAHCSYSFLQVLFRGKVLWILLNQSDYMQKFLIQHMLDLGLLLQILEFTCLFHVLSCNFDLVLCLIAFQNSWVGVTSSFVVPLNIQDWSFYRRDLVF